MGCLAIHRCCTRIGVETRNFVAELRRVWHCYRELNHMKIDVYHKWLGVPPAEQPPTHYRLLGLALHEADPDVIDNAAFRQMAHVRNFSVGPNSEASQELLRELAEARAVLLDVERKRAYDAELQAGSDGVNRKPPVSDSRERAAKPVASLRQHLSEDQVIRFGDFTCPQCKAKRSFFGLPDSENAECSFCKKRVARSELQAATKADAQVLKKVERTSNAGRVSAEEDLHVATPEVSTLRKEWQLGCPRCAVSLDVPKHLRGKHVRCSSCKTTLRISRDGSQCFPDDSLGLFLSDDFPLPRVRRGQSVTERKTASRVSRRFSPRRYTFNASRDSTEKIVGWFIVSTVILVVVGYLLSSQRASFSRLLKRFSGNPPAEVETAGQLVEDHADQADGDRVGNLEHSVATEATESKAFLEPPESGVSKKMPSVAQLESFENIFGMKMISVPRGSCMMGSPSDEVGRSSDEVLHRVRLSQEFFIASTEVTNQQYRAALEKNSGGVFEPALPVTDVSWQDALRFCEQLSKHPLEIERGFVYQLPTEAQWEYACRAGTTTRFSFGNEIALLGNYAAFWGNHSGSIRRVATGKPNYWGLYDMHGNVHEWCSDYWHTRISADFASDPRGPSFGVNHVIRGGSVLDAGEQCRSAARREGRARGGNLGFRVIAIRVR